MAAPVRNTAEPQVLPPQLKDFIHDWQEREYRRLAKELGLGSDAMKAYERLARPPMPAGHASSQKLQQDIGIASDFRFRSREWQRFDSNISELYARYFSAGTPTPYEDPNRYPVMAMIFDSLQEALSEYGWPPTPRPVLATLPSGSVDARVVIEPETHTPIVFFDHGLFQYLYHFALLTGWAIPPLSTRQLSDDRALGQLGQSHSMPFRASEFFASTLYAYVVDGAPGANAYPIDQPTHNLVTSVELLAHMERFVMAHELAHLKLGHLDEPPSWRLELEADASALGLVATLSRNQQGSWAMGYWACELVLIALTFLYRSISLLQFGPQKMKWTSATHPDPLSRRESMRRIWLEPEMPQTGIAAARELAGMSEALFQQLWELSLPALYLGYNRGARPSPKWNDLIAHTFASVR